MMEPNVDQDKINTLDLLQRCKSRSTFLPLDLKMSLFSAALHSYRCDSILKPFPNKFITSNKEKLFDEIHKCLGEIPTLFKLKESQQLNSLSWYLLNWILTTGSLQLIFKSIDSEEIRKILPSHIMNTNYKPDYVFEIVCPRKERFVEAKNTYGSFFAFHGSKIENFHSILHNGLINCLNKRHLFGEGTYLSSELSVAIEFSPFGSGWSKSVLGKQLSCVAVCEVVKHPDIKPERNGSPDAYYVIQNDDHIKVAYLLVYCKYGNLNSDTSRSPSWFSRKYLFVMTLLIIIIAVLFSKSIHFRSFKHY